MKGKFDGVSIYKTKLNLNGVEKQNKVTCVKEDVNKM